jgi:hypothetical protein
VRNINSSLIEVDCTKCENYQMLYFCNGYDRIYLDRCRKYNKKILDVVNCVLEFMDDPCKDFVLKEK